jgi:SAM-dependent methyltransferase
MTPDDGDATVSALGCDEAARGAAFLRGVLPDRLVPVFGERFIRSHVLYGEFVCRLVLGVVRESGIADAIVEPTGADEVAARAGPHARAPIDWMLRYLAARGWIEASGGEPRRRYRSRGALPALDALAVREEQRRWDPSWMPAYALAETVAQDYPAFLGGRMAGEEVLFAPRRLRLWVDYFSNDNGLYVVNNRVGAVAAVDWLPAGGAVVLELGAGLASGAVALLEEIEARGRLGDVRGYRFTEPVSAFLRRGAETLRRRYPSLAGLTTESLDMNRPFAEQGVPPASVDLAYAVNTLHAAFDLAFTLGEIRTALSPGGRLVIAECVPPPEPIYADFVFNLAETFRAPRLDPVFRPHGGFLGPAHWSAAMTAAGLEDVRVLPEVARIRVEVPDWSVAAIGAARPADG